MAVALITVSGVIDPDIEEKSTKGEQPVTDYMLMARKFDADLLDYQDARDMTGWLGRIIEKILGINFLLAWACYLSRHKYPVIMTDGEQVGIPLAVITKLLSLGSRPYRHLMIAHILSVSKKMIFFDWFHIQSHIDTFFVYASWQKKFIEQQWAISSDRVVFTPFMVNADFFSHDQVVAESEYVKQLRSNGVGVTPIICSVGLEFRDYPTLIEAVRGQDVHLVIAAGSPWSKRDDSTQGQDIPKNVSVHKFSQYELRQLYADCDFVVMPLYDVNFQAGVTALLESMAMSKAVICTQTLGQTDVVIEGITGMYVPIGDSMALQDAIQHLLDNPKQALEMGAAGRERIEREMSLDMYVRRLSDHIQTSLCRQFILENGLRRQPLLLTL